MARIRTIKPEFATDGKIDQLSDSCALFFALLWCHCDDFGYFTSDTRELSLKLPRWTSQAIVGFLSRLSRVGLVRVSRKAGVGLVTGWEHQRIKDRRASKWNDAEIEWDAPEDDAPGSEKNGPGKERKGRERKGREVAQATAAPVESVPENSTNTFLATYCEAFKRRYDSNPPITGKAAGIAKRVVKDLGLSRACQLIETYLAMGDGFYLTRRHDLATFSLNLNAVAVKHDTGATVTRQQVRSAELTEGAQDQLRRIAEGRL